MKGCVLLILSHLLIYLSVKADKLSANQRAPVYASGAGGLSLPLPRSKAQGPGGGSADDVVHEIMESVKTDGGEFIRVVSGRVAYTSPEGLPVSIKYMADENGNRASFTIGNPSGGKSSSPGSSGGRAGGSKGGSNKNDLSGGKEKYLPPNQNKDRTYLPPK